MLTRDQQNVGQMVRDIRTGQVWIIGGISGGDIMAIRTRPFLARDLEAVTPGALDSDSTLQAVLAELDSATKKFPTWPTDPMHALSVVGEEFGELTKEVVQLVYEPHKASFAKLQEEAIQTAAMALRFAMSLGRYKFRPGEQHCQVKGTLPAADVVDDDRGA